MEPRPPLKQWLNDVIMTSIQTYLLPGKIMRNWLAQVRHHDTMSVFIYWLLFQLTESKHPRTPAAKTGRQALDNKLSLLSKTRKVKWHFIMMMLGWFYLEISRSRVWRYQTNSTWYEEQTLPSVRVRTLSLSIQKGIICKYKQYKRV